MDYELTSKKLDDGTTLVKNKHTNQPVAFLSKYKHGSANAVKAEWHPDFKLMHPETHENLVTRNFPKHFDSASAAVSSLTSDSRPYVEGQGVHTDPLKTKYIGATEGVNDYGEKTVTHNWHLHDQEGNRVGTLSSRYGPEVIHRQTPVRIGLKKDVNDSIPDSVKESASKRFPGDDVASSLHRVRYMIDNKNKEPRFIGTQAAKDSSYKVFKTKLSPEDASKAYEEHMRSTHAASPSTTPYTYTRHSPISFTAMRAADSKYGSGTIHHVISMPGELHHTTAHMAHRDYEHAPKNAEIVESTEKTYSTVSLEEHVVRSLNKQVSPGKMTRFASFRSGK